MFKTRSVTGIMSQFQATVDQLEALSKSKTKESLKLSSAVLKVEDLGDRFQMWVYNLHRRINTAIDDFQLSLADKLHEKALDADDEAEEAQVMAAALRTQFNLK